MDPITQGAVGSVFAQSVSDKKNILKFCVIGLLAGLAPDLDVFIRSSDDPILFLKYHRQFTHSLIFIPIGALFVSFFVYPFFKSSVKFKHVYLASFLGYATHGLIDACTSYGTQLLWPFSTERITWNNISIVDPLFTIPVLILIVTAVISKKKIFSFCAIGWILFYLTIGFLQYDRAKAIVIKIADSRGHSYDRMTLKPSFGNLVLWRSIYQFKDKFYVDAVRVGKSSTWCTGGSTKIFDFEYHLPDLDQNSQQKRDIDRFSWFSQDYLGFDVSKSLVTDIRYSLIPNELEPMWGLIIDVHKDEDKSATWWAGRNLNQDKYNLFLNMLSGRSCNEFFDQ